MISLTTMVWTAALVALGAGALFGFARLREARNLRLMRFRDPSLSSRRRGLRVEAKRPRL